jgi:hypothetical protein
MVRFLSMLLACAVLLRAAPGHAEPETFVDAEGRTQEFQPMFDAWFGGDREAHPLRAAGEVLVWVGLGTAYYWVKKDVNRLDWDRPNLADRILFEAVRFDNNLGTTNNVLHPLGGAAYYGFTRVNGLPPGWSFLYAFTASTLWEYALEWRELVSINDLIFTPIGGLAIGEFAFQLGEYLASAPGKTTVAQDIARVGLGWPAMVHRAIDKPVPPPPLPADNLGFSSAYWHDFALSYEYGHSTTNADRTTNLHGVRGEAEIIAMPGFLRPGRFSTGFSEGNFTEGRLRMMWGERRRSDADLWVQAVPFGWYGQDIERVRAAGAVGHAFMIGGSSALRYRRHTIFGPADELAVAHLFGPSTSLWLTARGLTTRLWANAHPDFASIQSLAYPVWVSRFGEEGMKSTLLAQGYQFHLGGSGRAGLDVRYDAVEASLQVGYGAYGSLQGRDRKQEEVTRDVPGTERVFEHATWLRLRPPGAPVFVGAGLEWTERWSRLGSVEVHHRDRRLLAGGGLRF